VLRKNSPRVRYWVWLSASLKFLVPFALLVSLGSVVPRPARHAGSAPVPVFPSTLVQIAEPLSPTFSSTVPAYTPMHRVPIVIGVMWALGFAAITSVRCRSWFRIRAALRASKPVDLPIPVPAFIAPGAEEPGVVGFLRPVLVLPAQLLERLNPRQLNAVLTHEMCHVRRRDNLFAAVHMVVEAIFWFHPLVWWIGARMVEERELACDEEVLRMGCEPTDYVEGILKVCRFYTESPLPCVSGVTGADVKKRLRAILAGSIAHELNFGRKVALAAIGLAALAAPIAIGVMDAPLIHAQAQVPAATPKWEAVSIRPAKDCGGPVPGAGATKDRKKAALDGGGRPGPSPGRLNMCTTIASLIPQAYLYQASGRARSTGGVVVTVPMEGAPGWVNSDSYQINAKAEGTPIWEMMMGPMMRALLEDRFKLKVRRENREVPAYAMTAAKGGSKLQAVKGTCATADCGPTGASRRGANMSWGVIGTADDFSKLLVFFLDRPVVDKTGLKGLFNFHLEFTPDETAPGFLARIQRLPDSGPAEAAADPTGGTSIFTAMREQLGLKLEGTKAPREILVIDRVERPSEN
jgi:bla regulator protein BlaR1